MRIKRSAVIALSLCVAFPTISCATIPSDSSVSGASDRLATAKPEINTVPNHFAPGSRPDEIGENSTKELEGHQFEYQYPTGRRYRIRFYDDRLSFQLLSEPNQPVRALPYRAQKVRSGQYLVHWMIPGRTGHVALVIDIPRDMVHVGALMPGQQELFDEARIEKHIKY